MIFYSQVMWYCIIIVFQTPVTKYNGDDDDDGKEEAIILDAHILPMMI